MKLQRFIDVSQSPDLPSLERRLVDFAYEMDFGLVSAALVIEQSGMEPMFLTVGNPPDAYAQSQSDLASSKRDPVLAHLKSSNVPFIYDQRTYQRHGAVDLWEEQAAHGFRTGLAVALHMPGNKHFLLGIDRSAPLPKREDRVTRMLADLQLLAVHAQDVAVRLLSQARQSAPAPSLSPREREILKWTMEGKSAWAVGEILGVSENTVKFHLRNVFRKLNSSSKHQAVLKALSLGLL